MYPTYADDSIFFVRDIPLVKELINNFNQFYHLSGLKGNIKKCEIAGIGFLKGVTNTVCGLKFVDLSNDTIKILIASSSFVEFTLKYYILSNEGSKKKIFRYSIISNDIFSLLRYQINKIHPVEIEIIVQIEFVF